MSWWLNDKRTMLKEALTPRTQRMNRNHQLKGNHIKMQKRIERLQRNLKKIQVKPGHTNLLIKGL